MGTQYVQDYVSTNPTLTADGAFHALTNNLGSRDHITIVNQGAANDMTTALDIEIVFGNTTTPTHTGMILQLKDSVTYPANNSITIWYKTSTATASISYLEFEKVIS